MTLSRTFLPVAALSVAAACTAAVSANTVDVTQAASDDAPALCEVAVATAGRSVNLQARVNADTDLSGTYRFSIAKTGAGNRTMINQGGRFSVAAGETRTLGQTTLGGNAGSYDATLTLEVNGKTYTCSSSDPTTEL